MLHLLRAALQGVAQDFNAAVAAAERLQATPTIELTVSPADAAFADALRRNLHAETMTELEKRLERKFVRKTGA